MRNMVRARIEQYRNNGKHTTQLSMRRWKLTYVIISATRMNREQFSAERRGRSRVMYIILIETIFIALEVRLNVLLYIFRCKQVTGEGNARERREDERCDAHKSSSNGNFPSIFSRVQASIISLLRCDPPRLCHCDKHLSDDL